MLERQLCPAQVLRDGALNQQPARSHVTAYLWTTTIPTSVEVQGLGPWRGLGQRPNLPLPQRQMVWAPAYNSTTAPIPRSGFVLGRNLTGCIRNCRFGPPTTTSRHSFMEIVDGRHADPGWPDT